MVVYDRSQGILVLVVITWLFVRANVPPGAAALEIALLLLGIAWLGTRLASTAVYRLGWSGKWFLLQLAIWFGVFLYLVQAPPGTKVLLLWGIAIPLVILGGLWRAACARFERLHRIHSASARILLPLVFGYLSLGFWMANWPLWRAPLAAVTVGSLALIPLYYGWQLGAPRPRGVHDARFGSEDSYHRAGMSDEF